MKSKLPKNDIEIQDNGSWIDNFIKKIIKWNKFKHRSD
jgi:hypothetical protein